MWPPDAAGRWSPVVTSGHQWSGWSVSAVSRGTTQGAAHSSSHHSDTQSARSSADQCSGIFTPSPVPVRPGLGTQQSESGWEIVNAALLGEEWCSPSLTTAQFKYWCGWWCMTKLPPARPSPVTGTKGCLQSRVCPQLYTTSEHWTRHSIQ